MTSRLASPCDTSEMTIGHPGARQGLIKKIGKILLGTTARLLGSIIDLIKVPEILKSGITCWKGRRLVAKRLKSHQEGVLPPRDNQKSVEFHVSI